MHDVHAGLVVRAPRRCGSGRAGSAAGDGRPRCRVRHSRLLGRPRWWHHRRRRATWARLEARLGSTTGVAADYGLRRVGARARCDSGGAGRRPGRHRRARRTQAAVGRWRRWPCGSASDVSARRPGRPGLGQAAPTRGARHAALLRLRRTSRPRARSGAATEAERPADQRPRLPARPPPRAGRRAPVRRRGPGMSARAGAPGHPVHDRPLTRTGPTGAPSPSMSTRSRSCSPCGRGEAYADLPDHPEVALDARRSTSCGAVPRRTASSVCWRSATTPSSWPPPSRPPSGTRWRSGSGRCTPSPWPGRDGRPSRWRPCATSAECWPTSSVSTRARSCATSNRPCWSRTPAAAVAPTPRCPGPRPPVAAPSDAPRTAGWAHRRPRAGGGRARGGARPRGRRGAGVALLVGEPGIGKSRLVERVTESAQQRGFVVATGRCAQDDGAPPLWPWSQALDELARHDQRVLEHRGRAPAQRGPDTDDAPRPPNGRRSGRGRASRARCSSARRRTPVLLVLEDLHWADTASLKVLRRLLASTAARPAPRRGPLPSSVAGADGRTCRGRRGPRPPPRGAPRPRRPERRRPRAGGRGGRRSPPTPRSSPSGTPARRATRSS